MGELVLGLGMVECRVVDRRHITELYIFCRDGVRTPVIGSRHNETYSNAMNVMHQSVNGGIRDRMIYIGRTCACDVRIVENDVNPFRSISFPKASRFGLDKPGGEQGLEEFLFMQGVSASSDITSTQTNEL